MYDGTLNGHAVVGQLDSGATHAFMSLKAAELCGLDVDHVVTEIELGNNSLVKASGMTIGRFCVNGYETDLQIYTLDMPDKRDGLPLLTFGRKWLEVDNPNVDWHTNCIHITRNDGAKWTIHPRKSPNLNPTVAFKKISLKKLSKLIRKKDNELFTVLVGPKLKNMSVANNFSDIISEFDDIFVEELPDSLPPSRDLDFEINLKSDEPPPVRPVIRLSTEELK